ncbi:MAG: nucleotidyltransferase domain-containing protein [archaeon]
MKTENKIIKHLVEDKESIIISELSRKIKADYKIIHTAVNRLVDKGILTSKKIGKSIQVSFNNRFSNEVFQVEYERREEILKNKNIQVMTDEIKKNLKKSNFVLLLFGSYAKRKESKNSDIDIMFIIDSKYEKKIDNIIQLLPLKIHYLIFTEEQFIDMKNSQELNVVKEAIKNNIILYGIEQYYDLIK